MVRLDNQKGLTLLEVLVSILILAGGCVYVLQALARSAQVQRQLESHNQLYPLLSSKMAMLESRIPQEKNPFKSEQRGELIQDRLPLRWRVLSQFKNLDEAKAPKETLGLSVLLDRVILVSDARGTANEELKLATWFRASIPENQA